MSDPLGLETRDGLPDPLKVLLAEYPRAGWQADPNFEGLVRFWMERHVMFRRMIATMREDSERLLDRALAEDDFARRLARIGSTFVGELHGHHHIEDAHYFPLLARSEPAIARGFALLDRDHQALDGHIAAFAERANAVLRAVAEATDARDPAGLFLGEVNGLGRLLDRHLEDEEELVVPVILKHGPGDLG